ncbi:V-type proton ATPase subunit S1 [Zerene cesonia]|uniref:V-type proton ATPase subunit S1 n=1 Tax=Zerene cesonia TaxID=33412 RepID=UPI0018E5172C|nr:V-type proton ATPase subunit S1 [Zerene cesonia]
MAFSRLVLSFLVLSVASSFASVSVPVFLWGDLAKPSIKSNPLSEVSELEFEDVLKSQLNNDPFTVVFIDETLSVEDLSRKNSEGETPFPYLHANIGDAVYLPSVKNALDVLNKFSDSNKADHVTLTENGLSAEIEKDSGKFLFITLKDAREGESRADMLRRHNDFMEEMFTKLQKNYDNVVSVYTGRFPSWTVPEAHSRVRRQAAPATYQNPELNGLRFYTKNIIITSKSGVTHLHGITASNSVIDAMAMNTTLDFGGNQSIVLYFTQKQGYWFMDSITYSQSQPTFTEELAGQSEVYALMGFSYRCGQNATFNSGNDTNQMSLTFQDLKVQPFFKDTNSSDTPPFGDSFNCVGFFSVPIWSGLFVVFILLAITFYGIMMMMDIRTMDRFDDPKGKTITINAAE